jgi:hypothetical protein
MSQPEPDVRQAAIEQNLRQVANLSDQLKLELDGDDVSPQARELLDALNWRARSLLPRDLAAAHNYGGLLTPEVIDAFSNIAVFVGGALVQNWIAKADNRVAQAILRRRLRQQPPTASQIKDFARLKLNVAWPGQIKASEDPHSESRGPNGWSVSWVKGSQEFGASGDNDLEKVTLTRRTVPHPAATQ